jgi:hypothetical protein
VQHDAENHRDGKRIRKMPATLMTVMINDAKLSRSVCSMASSRGLFLSGHP